MAKVVFEFQRKISNHYFTHLEEDLSQLWLEDQLYFVIRDVNPKNQSLEKLRTTAGELANKAHNTKVERVELEVGLLQQAYSNLNKEEVVVAFVEGWHLGNYRFETYKSVKTNQAAQLTFNDEANIKDLISKGEIRAAATAFSRDLMNEPPNTLNPQTFPDTLKERMKSSVEIIVHNKAALREMGMNGVLTVNRGSKYDPAFIELHYKGDETKPLIALVGKGVTFDTGGISLKKSRNISNMRMDMGGAAAVAGAIQLLAETNAKVNVVGLIQTVENIPGKEAMLPGEIITYKNGHTVQVGNTDAEGRLILADGLIRAGELGATYIADICTLTGSIVAALGPKMAGVFGEPDLLQEMKRIGDKNGDFVWPMPLIEAYDETLKNDYADFCNISNQAEAGAITAALFLRRFVPENSQWVHVDMAGTMETKQKGYYTNGATGFGARLLADFSVDISS